MSIRLSLSYSITAVTYGQGSSVPWILSTGFWNDDGVWDDSATWID